MGARPKAEKPAARPPAIGAPAAEVLPLLKEAAAAAREIADAGPAAYALLEIAATTLDAGDNSAARALVREALALFPRVKSAANIDKPAVAILAARLQTRLADVAEAFQTVELLHDEEDRDAARLTVVEALLSLEDYDGAIEACARFAEEDARDEARAAVAEALAAAGKIDKARALVKTIERESGRSYALVAMVQALLAAGDITAAQPLAEVIEDPASRCRALGDIVEAQLGADDRAGAKRTLAQAQELAQELPLDETFRLIALQAEAGEVREAVAVADALDDPDLRDHIVYTIATAVAAQGDPQEAARLMKTIKTREMHTPLVAAVALSQARAGETDAGVETARSIDDDDVAALAAALARIAWVQIESGDPDGARKMLAAALKEVSRTDSAEVWRSADSPEAATDRTWALINLFLDVGAGYAELGDTETARTVFGTAVQSTEIHEARPYLRASLVGEIAKTESQYGLSVDALAWSRKLKTPAVRESAILGVAEGLLARVSEEK